MVGIDSYLIFYVGSRTLALPVKEVSRIVPSVAMFPLNEPHPVVPGVIDVHGETILLYDLHRLYNEDPVELDLHHRFILITWKEKTRALWTDGVKEVLQFSVDTIDLPGSSRKASVVFQGNRVTISITSSCEIMEMAERYGHGIP